MAVAFSCGLALGVVVGASLWSGALYLARKMVEIAMRRSAAQQRQEILSQQKRIENAKAQLRMQYGDEMTKEQEVIMERELGKMYRDLPNPQIPKR